MRVVVMGAGAGGAAAVAELVRAGHDVAFWNRSPQTLAPFQALGGVAYDGVLGEGIARPRCITSDLAAATAEAEIAVVALPTFSHVAVAQMLGGSAWPADRPVLLNPGHTGGAFEFSHAFRARTGSAPAVAEFSTLTYVARKYRPDGVTITGRAKQVRAAALPGGEEALALATTLFPGASPVSDVLFADLTNVNLVLHPPGAVLGAAWIEATGGSYTFYAQGMTPGVARVMRLLDDERRAVARAFGHAVPNLIEEMKLIGTVEEHVADTGDFAGAISGGQANSAIKAPGSLEHRYYREDFGHGLLPFLELAAIAGVATPVAHALFTAGEALTGNDYRSGGRTAATMGIAGLSREALLAQVRPA